MKFNSSFSSANFFIKQLSLNGFRNYSAKKLNFTSDKVVFVGKNGRGKTNILEAISILSVGKSWRERFFFENKIPNLTKKNCNLIQVGCPEESAVIELETAQNNIYQVQIFPRKRIFKKNGKKISRKKQLNEIPTLLFAPEYLEIFSSAKKSRQSFFDRFLCQLDLQYKDLLTQTLRVIKQKNAIFSIARKENYSSGELLKQVQPWNEILSENIPRIWKFRENFLAELEPILQSELNKITKNNDKINIFLVRGGFDSEELTSEETSFKNTELDFSRELLAYRCLFSPTRDDFTLFYREQPVMNTVSRGEIRSILLALLSAKKKYFFAKTGKMPILLLDDCFSELDDNRQQGLEKLCEGTQAFFTTTHKEHFAKFSTKIQKIEI